MRFQKRSVRRARGSAAELSVARSTMRVNSPVPAERRMLSFSAKKPDGTVGFFAVKREIESQLNKKNKKLTIKVDYILLASICN